MKHLIVQPMPANTTTPKPTSDAPVEHLEQTTQAEQVETPEVEEVQSKTPAEMISNFFKIVNPLPHKEDPKPEPKPKEEYHLATSEDVTASIRNFFGIFNAV